MANDSKVLVRLQLLGGALFKRQAEEAGLSLDAIDAGANRAAAGLSRMRAATFRTQTTLRAMEGRMSGTTAALRGLGFVGGIGAAAGLYGAAKATITFDQGMRNVNSIAGLSEGQLATLSDQVRKLAGETAQQPTTLADGLYDLASSGFNANDSLTILRSTAKAATAGLTDTATSTKAVAAVLNAYHLNANRAAEVSDTLFQTVNRGVISFPELAQTIGDVLPFSSSLGVNLREVGAAVSTLTKEGISGAETMTRIKSAMQAFIKPSVGMNQAITRTGAASGEALIKQKGFQGALEAVIGTTNGSKEAVAKLFPNVRALSGALALTGKNAQSAHADLRGFADVSGLTDQVLAEQSKSLTYQWNKLKAGATSLGIAIGSRLVPAAAHALGAISKLTSSKGAVGQFAAGLTSGEGATVKRSRATAGGMTNDTVVQTSAGQRAGAAVRGVVNTIAGTVKTVGKAVLPFIGNLIGQLIDAIKPAMPFLQNILLPLLKGIGEGILGGIVGAIKIAVPIIKVLATVIGFVGKIAAPFKGIIEGIGVVIGVVFGPVILKAIEWLGKLGGVFRVVGVVARALRVPVQIVGAAIRGMIRVVAGLVSGFVRAITFVGRFAATLKGGARTVIVGATNLVGGVIHVVESLPGKVGSLVGKAVSTIAGVLKKGAGSVAGAAAMMWEGLKSGLVSALNWVIARVNDLIDAYNSLPIAPNVGHIGLVGGGVQMASPTVAAPAPTGRNLHPHGRAPHPVTGPGLAHAASVIVVHNHNQVLLDGREVHRSTTRHERALLETR